MAPALGAPGAHPPVPAAPVRRRVRAGAERRDAREGPRGQALGLRRGREGLLPVDHEEPGVRDAPREAVRGLGARGPLPRQPRHARRRAAAGGADEPDPRQPPVPADGRPAVQVGAGAGVPVHALRRRPRLLDEPGRVPRGGPGDHLRDHRGRGVHGPPGEAEAHAVVRPAARDGARREREAERAEGDGPGAPRAPVQRGDVRVGEPGRPGAGVRGRRGVDALQDARDARAGVPGVRGAPAEGAPARPAGDGDPEGGERRVRRASPDVPARRPGPDRVRRAREGEGRRRVPPPPGAVRPARRARAGDEDGRPRKAGPRSSPRRSRCRPRRGATTRRSWRS